MKIYHIESTILNSFRLLVFEFYQYITSVKVIMAKSLIVIPARLAATRLPDKPLAEIAGEPRIVHVWRRAIEADCGPVVG